MHFQSKTVTNKKIKAGITIGDINGIGMEVIIKTFADGRMLDICTPIVYGSSKILSYHRKVTGSTDFSFNIVKSADGANPDRTNIINCWDEDVNIELGKPTKIAGQYALKSLEAAVSSIKNKEVDVLITSPINKNNIQSEEFGYAGHTEYLAGKFEASALMIMVCDNLKVGVLTGHDPVGEVAASLSVNKVLVGIKTMNKSLIEDFGIRKPKIAVLGLNPHAGDGGLIGDEEGKYILPAVNEAKDKNIIAIGPYSADGFFGSANYSNFDGILAMYHDQGLIPFKVLSFEHGVNYTAGLPVVRTSPDHGTAYEIAGKNEASPSSFREAIYLACSILRSRTGFNKLHTDQLKHAVLEKDA